MVMMDGAAEEAYIKHSEQLVRMATVLVGPSDADDVVAVAVLRVFESNQWGGVRDPEAYLVRAVVNEARSSRRSAGRRRNRELRAARLDPGVGPTASVDPRVIAAIDSLSVRQRAVIYLSYWEDEPIRNIAALLGCSDGSVRRHLARARAQLRKALS